MKKIFFISLILFSCFKTFAQQKVENIKTEKEVIKFLSEYYFRAKRINVSIDYYRNNYFRNKASDKKTINYFDSKNTYHWLKMDLNNDGKLDLIWNGCINKAASVLAFVSNKKNGYSVSIISDSEENETLHLINPYKKDGFILTRIDPLETFVDTSYRFEDRFMYDTITLNKNVFVEYNTLRRTYSIDTIICTVKGIFTSTGDTVTICSDGKIFFSQVFYEKDKMRILVLSKKLSKDSMRYIFSVANELPFYSFRKNYRYVSNSIRDASTLHFDFVFKNGKKQKLSAYHTCIPFGIKLLAETVKKLRIDKNWELKSNLLVDY